MNKIALIDVDGSNFPNLALMKISAYHKAAGDSVEWYDSLFSKDIDKLYMSKVFTFTPDYNSVLNAREIIRGGTGYDVTIALPLEIEGGYPDYSLYGIPDTAYGYLTRGCPRGCEFCIVKDKEGTVSRRVAYLKDFWHGQKDIVLLDPNLIACKDRIELLQELIDSGAFVDITQGIDARLLTEEICYLMKQMRIKCVHFAWDRYQDKEIIIEKLSMFQRIVGLRFQEVIVYVLCNYDTTLEQDLERIYTLRDMGINPYVMIYEKQKLPRGHILISLQRWCNGRRIFRSVPFFDDYKREKSIQESLF